MESSAPAPSPYDTKTAALMNALRDLTTTLHSTDQQRMKFLKLKKAWFGSGRETYTLNESSIKGMLQLYSDTLEMLKKTQGHTKRCSDFVDEILSTCPPEAAKPSEPDEPARKKQRGEGKSPAPPRGKGPAESAPHAAPSTSTAAASVPAAAAAASPAAVATAPAAAVPQAAAAVVKIEPTAPGTPPPKPAVAMPKPPAATPKPLTPVKPPPDLVGPEIYEKGTQVAAKISGPKKRASECHWILATIVKYWKGQDRYEIQDDDPGDEQNPVHKHYKLPRDCVVLLPPRDEEPPPIPKDTAVLAIFPNTTTFYTGVVASGPTKTRKGQTLEYKIRFDDDTDESGQTPMRRIDARYVLRIPFL